MKKTMIAMMVLTGAALADTVTLDNTYYTNPAGWVYIWNSATNTWDWTKNLTDTAVTTGTNTPGRSDAAFIGYDITFVDGKQILTSTGETIDMNQTTTPTWVGRHMFVGSNVIMSDNDNGYGNPLTIHMEDFGAREDTLYSGGRFWMTGNVSYVGSLTLTDDEFSRTLFSVTTMEQCSGTWDAAGITVKDANGNVLTYTTDAANIGEEGYYWLTTSEYVNKQAYSVVLNAKGITAPEPATATLSLLALAGLAARRRRH